MANPPFTSVSLLSLSYKGMVFSWFSHSLILLFVRDTLYSLNHTANHPFFCFSSSSSSYTCRIPEPCITGASTSPKTPPRHHATVIFARDCNGSSPSVRKISSTVIRPVTGPTTPLNMMTDTERVYYIVSDPFYHNLERNLLEADHQLIFPPICTPALSVKILFVMQTPRYCLAKPKH